MMFALIEGSVFLNQISLLYLVLNSAKELSLKRDVHDQGRFTLISDSYTAFAVMIENCVFNKRMTWPTCALS
jgi:hypothetical protein